MLHVRQQLSRGSSSNPAKLVSMKSNAATRDVGLVPELVGLLRRHKMASAHKGESDLVFGTAAGKPLSQRNAARALTAAADKAGLNGQGKPPLGFHDLRHSWVSRLIAAGLDVVVVQRAAGHSSAATTLTLYAHAWETARRSEETISKIAATGLGAVLTDRI